MPNLDSAQSFGECLALFIWYSLIKSTSFNPAHLHREHYRECCYLHLQFLEKS